MYATLTGDYSRFLVKGKTISLSNVQAQSDNPTSLLLPGINMNEKICVSFYREKKRNGEANGSGFWDFMKQQLNQFEAQFGAYLKAQVDNLTPIYQQNAESLIFSHLSGGKGNVSQIDTFNYTNPLQMKHKALSTTSMAI